MDKTSDIRYTYIYKHKTSNCIQRRLLLFKFYGKVEVFQIFCRYYEKCLQLFKNPKEIKSPKRKYKLPEEYNMRYVERSINNLPDKWTSMKLHELCKENREE